MTKLQITARLQIHPGKLEALKQAAADCQRSVRDNDTGTLQYDWFVSADGSECVVRESYASSDALLSHVANLGATVESLLDTADMFVEICGVPSAELLAALADLPHRVYGPLDGA